MDEYSGDGIKQEPSINEQRYLEDDTNENKMRDTESSEKLPELDASCEVLNSSDNGSWTSDTPLLPVQTTTEPGIEEYTKCNVLKDNFNGTCTIDKESDRSVYVDIHIDRIVDYSTPLEDQLHVFGSGVSVAYSHVRDAEKLKTNPLHVFGSGWEFGSVCSINLHSSEDHANDANPEAPPWQGRLLTRIFKEKINGVKSNKTDIKDRAEFISEETNDIPTDIANAVESKNLKNLLVLSAGITFLYTAVFGLRNLQSSINSQDGLGVFSLANMSGAFMFGSLVSRFVVQRFQPKICLSVSCFGHLIYVVANYYPSFYVIIPASIVQGLSSALLWNAICTYITEIGLDEARVKCKDSCSVLSRYFGIFFLILQLSMVLGNLISSLILSMSENRIQAYQNQQLDEGISNELNQNISEFTSVSNISTQFKMTCGVGQCGVGTEREMGSGKDELDIVFLLGTYSSCTILAILVIQCCLDQLTDYTPRSPSFKVAMKQAGYVLGIMVDRKFCFIVMLCLYTVLSNGFVVADVLKAFITCPIGIRMVGYSMICFGIFGSVSSYMFGKLAKYIGHVGVFLTAAVMNLASLGVMVKWEPTGEDQYLLFALIGVWGFADGIWQSQINSLVSSVFADRYETAFGCCRVLQGLGGFIVFTMSVMICMRLKIIITAVSCFLAVVLYLIMEIISRRSKTT